MPTSLVWFAPAPRSRPWTLVSTSAKLRDGAPCPSRLLRPQVQARTRTRLGSAGSPSTGHASCSRTPASCSTGRTPRRLDQDRRAGAGDRVADCRRRHPPSPAVRPPLDRAGVALRDGPHSAGDLTPPPMANGIRRSTYVCGKSHGAPVRRPITTSWRPSRHSSGSRTSRRLPRRDPRPRRRPGPRTGDAPRRTRSGLRVARGRVEPRSRRYHVLRLALSSGTSRDALLGPDQAGRCLAREDLRQQAGLDEQPQPGADGGFIVGRIAAATD
jgi:hypothetical protein